MDWTSGVSRVASGSLRSVPGSSAARAPRIASARSLSLATAPATTASTFFRMRSRSSSKNASFSRSARSARF